MAKSGMIAAVAVLLLLPAGLAPGQSFRCDWYTVNAGGAPGSGTGFIVNGSTGQAVQGPASRPMMLGHWGFWYGERINAKPPAPPIPIAPPNGGNVGTTRPKLWVREVANAAEFHFRVYDGATLVTEGSSDSRGWQVNVDLEIGRVYHWDCAVRVGFLWSRYYEPCWSFRVVEVPWPYGWVEVAPIPADPRNSRTMVRRGSWLAVAPGPGGQPYVYAVKGNRQHNLYRYNPIASGHGEWVELPTPVPKDQAGGRPIERGCRGVGDGERYLYVMHGNKSQAFWRYDIQYTDTATAWTRMPDVPLAPSLRPPRGGGYLVHVSGNPGYVYVMKGDRRDFYRFNTADQTWEELEQMPPGLRGKWDRDSWLATDGDATIYAHQAKDYRRTREQPEHFFYRYDISRQAWDPEPLAGMPLFGQHGNRLQFKRAKEGGSGTYNQDDGRVWALKGGNTQQFWVYDPHSTQGVGGLWSESDTMPSMGSTARRRRVNAGGYIVYFSHGDYQGFLALKGNKTQEFWRYVIPPYGEVGARPERSGVMADDSEPAPFADIGPNPLTGGRATLRYSLPGNGRASVRVYDVTGRAVLTRSVAASRSGVVSLDLRSLSAGIYLVKVEADGYSGTQKLVVQQ